MSTLSFADAMRRWIEREERSVKELPKPSAVDHGIKPETALAIEEDLYRKRSIRLRELSIALAKSGGVRG